MKAQRLSIIMNLILFSTIFASCTNDMLELENEKPLPLKQIVMTTEDFHSEAGSRTLYDIADGAVKCTWAANDTVGVFPEGGFQVPFPMTSGTGSNSATFNGEGWALKNSVVYMAYYPMQGKFYLDKENIPVKYTGQTVTENGSTAHLGKYDYMVTSATTPEFGIVNFQFKHVGALICLKVKMKETSTIDYVNLLTDESVFTEAGHIDLTETTPSIKPSYNVKSFKVYLNNIAVEANKELIVYFLMPPADLTDKTLKAVIHKKNGYFQEIPLTGKNFEAGKAYELTTTMTSEEETPATIHVETAGSFETAIRGQYGSNCLNLTSLKITGNLNGTDIRFIRKMAGRKEDGATYSGKLNHLDLTDANIVAGGDYYYKTNSGTEYKTEKDVAGDYMFYFCNLKTIKFPLTITKLGKQVCSHMPKAVGNEGVNIGDDYIGTFTSIIIPSGVIIIDDYAFAWNQNLPCIELPDNLKTVGYGAFYRCDALTTINIPNSVEGCPCFLHCHGLQHVKLPENPNFTYMGYGAFMGCRSLKSVTIPASVVTISDTVFGSEWEPSVLEEIHFKSTTPPSIHEKSGLPKYWDCKIFVPQGSYNAYKTNSSFKDYTIIEE